MSFQEKKTLASIVSGFLVLTAYGIYAFDAIRSGAAATADLRFWAVAMLVFIGVGIGVAILVQILFHIAFAISVAVRNKLRDESCADAEIEKQIAAETVEDERDREIERKAMRYGFAFAGLGFLAGLIVLAAHGSPAVMLNVMYLSFAVGSLVEGFVQFRLYRRG